MKQTEGYMRIFSQGRCSFVFSYSEALHTHYGDQMKGEEDE